MKTRSVGLLCAAAVAVGVTIVSISPAEAGTAPVLFTKIQYNSPGTDNRSNASLNAEWVRLTNKTAKTINLKNWTVRDRQGHVYRFSGTYYVKAGKNVYIHTGRGTDGKPDIRHRYWRSGNYIWNNTGDTATLRNPSNKTIDTCKWGSSGSFTYC